MNSFAKFLFASGGLALIAGGVTVAAPATKDQQRLPQDGVVSIPETVMPKTGTTWPNENFAEISDPYEKTEVASTFCHDRYRFKDEIKEAPEMFETNIKWDGIWTTKQRKRIETTGMTFQDCNWLNMMVLFEFKRQLEAFGLR